MDAQSDQSNDAAPLFPSVSPPERGTKYRPLFDYLRHRTEDEVGMTLASVESS